jgi:DNA polymerase-3 subunit delta'
LFNNVFGHERVKGIIGRMIANDSLHHGLCFYGPSGIGKCLFAQETARAMLCLDKTGEGDCIHCHKMDSGNHPDFQVIEPDGADIKVQQIREIAENLHYRPLEGRVRVIVIDGAERMREEAANAFLKSLEEPPEYLYFILVCTDLDALLPTIRSRCQKIPFQSLGVEDKARILTERFHKDEETALRLARISFRRLETENEAWDLFQNDVTHILKYLEMIFGQGHALDYLSDIVREKTVFPRFHDHLIAVLREFTHRAFGLPSSPLFHSWQEPMEKLLPRAPREQWRKLTEMTVRLHGQRRMNPNLALWFNASSVVDLGLLESSERKQRAVARR